MNAPLVLINNVYSYRNRGDSAIVEAMALYLRELAPHARICLLSQYWAENQPYYQRAGFESAPPLWDIPMDRNKPRRLCRAAGALAPLLWPVARRPGPTLKLYQAASVIVDAGGGSLFSSNRYAFYLGLYQHLFNLWMGVRLGKPVVLAPQSIGPFNKSPDWRAVRRLLRRLRCVMVREPISERLLAEWAVPCQQIPDAAFLDRFLPGENPRLPGLLARLRATPPGQITVGVTVLDWAWAQHGPQTVTPPVDTYLDKLAHALGEAGRARPLRVFVVPQVTAGFGDSDRQVSQALCDRLAGRVAAVELVDEDLVAADLKQVYGACDLVVGSRMHSTILAMLAGVPTIGLAYQPKTTGVFEQLGLADWVLDIAGFAPADLSASLQRMSDNRQQLRDRVRASTTQARARVEAAFRREIGPFLSRTEPPAGAA